MAILQPLFGAQSALLYLPPKRGTRSSQPLDLMPRATVQGLGISQVMKNSSKFNQSGIKLSICYLRIADILSFSTYVNLSTWMPTDKTIKTFLFIFASTVYAPTGGYRIHGKLNGWPQNVSIWDSMEGGMMKEACVKAGVKMVSRAPRKIMSR